MSQELFGGRSRCPVQSDSVLAAAEIRARVIVVAGPYLRTMTIDDDFAAPDQLGTTFERVVPSSWP